LNETLQPSIDDILAEVVRLTTPSVRQPGDFTIHEYMDAFKQQNGFSITTGAANPWLEDLVNRGILERLEDVYDPENSRRCTVYRKVSE